MNQITLVKTGEKWENDKKVKFYPPMRARIASCVRAANFREGSKDRVRLV